MLLQPRCLRYPILEVLLNTQRAVPPKNFPLPQQFECSKPAFLGENVTVLRLLNSRGSFCESTRRHPLQRGALGLSVTGIWDLRAGGKPSCWFSGISLSPCICLSQCPDSRSHEFRKNISRRRPSSTPFDHSCSLPKVCASGTSRGRAGISIS